MRKLLSANVVCLFHDKFFRIGMVFMAVAGAWFRITMLPGKGEEYIPQLEDGFMMYALFSSILLAAFCSLFIGRDYRDGTIRNKIMAGYSRLVIYLSNLLICVVAGLLLCFAYMIPSCVVGIPLMGFFHYPLAILVQVLYSLMAATAFASIFTLVSMLNHNRSAAVVICMLGIFSSLLFSFYLYSKLNEPEYYPAYWFEMGGEESGVDEDVPNPGYIRGAKRDWYEFLTDFLPTSQSILLCGGNPVHTVALVYDSVIILTTTLGGLYCFRRQDLN